MTRTLAIPIAYPHVPPVVMLGDQELQYPRSIDGMVIGSILGPKGPGNRCQTLPTPIPTPCRVGNHEEWFEAIVSTQL